MATLEELQRSQEILEIRKETAKALGDEKELQEILLELQKTKLQIQLDGLEAGEKQTALQEQLNAISQQQVKSATSLGQSMREAFSALSEGNTATGQIGKSLADVAKNGLNVASALKAVRDITLAAVVETDKLRAEYVKLTGDVSDAGKAFTNLAITNSELAISMEAMMKATVELRKGFSQFAFVSQDVRDTLTLQAATMEKVGVSAGTTAESLNTLTMAFGMTTTEAMDTQREMVGLAVALGRPPQEMVQEFNKALPDLAKFGDRAVEVFRDLQITARETGTSISDLTAIVGDQMDTFEGSAKVAGRLNAVMGTDLVSGTELLMATEAERVEILRERLALSGQDFESMGRFQKMAVANAAGIRDVATAAKLFGNEQGQVAEMIGDTGISTAEMEEMAMKATDSFTQLKFVFMQLAVAVKPFADLFGMIIDGFVKFIDMIPGGLGTLVAVAALAAAPFTGGATLAGLGALATTGALAGATQAIGDGVISNGRVTPIDSADQVIAAKPGGPIDQAMGGTGGSRGNPTNLVVQVMLDNRQLGEAIVPHIDKRVLGTS
jgi:hypothetical protein